MAKIKIKLGENEVEIESRDFYVDNATLGEVIESVTKHMPESQVKIIYQNDDNQSEEKTIEISNPNLDTLNILDDAEAFEPEFNEPSPISSNEIKSKLKILEQKSFFSKPRTVSETVEQLREHGWQASPLDVSKTLAQMAVNREIIKDSRERKSYYFTSEALLTN